MDKFISLMIVDDKKIDRDILRNIFESEYNIIEAEDGVAALEILKGGAIVDAMILDIYMPNMDGFELLKVIKSDEGYKDIAVIVSTEIEAAENEEKALMLGADEFIFKPYNKAVIVRRVRNVVENIVYNQYKVKASNAELKFRIQRDMLTGLFNKDTFYIKASYFIRERNEQCVVCIWDIDRFKVINELFGSKKGDDVLQGVARKLVQILDKNGLCTRAQSDRFVFVTTLAYFEEKLTEIESV